MRRRLGVGRVGEEREGGDVVRVGVGVRAEGSRGVSWIAGEVRKFKFNLGEQRGISGHTSSRSAHRHREVLCRRRWSIRLERRRSRSQRVVLG